MELLRGLWAWLRLQVCAATGVEGGVCSGALASGERLVLRLELCRRALGEKLRFLLPGLESLRTLWPDIISFPTAEILDRPGLGD